MASQPTPNPETQRGLLKVIKALTTMPAQVVFYGSALLAVAATGGIGLPSVLGTLGATVGVNVLSNMLERVARGDEVPDEEIRKTIEAAISNSGIEKLATSNEFQRAIAHVFRQFDLLKYAVQRGEFTIIEKLTEQFAQHKAILEELQIELAIVREQLEILSTREQGDEILRLVRQIPELKELSKQTLAANEKILTTIKQIEISANTLRVAQPPMHIPTRAPFFIGREELLSELTEGLEPGHIVTLFGPGGIGKSALAAEVIWRLKDENVLLQRFPDGILSFNFYGQPKVEFALEHFARALGEQVEPTLQAAAQRALAGKKILLFLDGTEVSDNLNQIIQVAGTCGVLITSRLKQDIYEKSIQVSLLPKDASIPLLESWANNSIKLNIASEICNLIGFLPLAVRIAGTYLMRTGMQPEEYRKWLCTTPLSALDQGKRQNQSVDVLLEKSLLHVSETAKLTLGALGRLAFTQFTSSPIEESLQQDSLSVQRALGELVDYSLINFNGEYYQASHRLIHEYARLMITLPKSVVERLFHFYEHYAIAQTEDGLFSITDPGLPHIMALLQIKTESDAEEVLRTLRNYTRKYFNYVSYTSLDWLTDMMDNRSTIANNPDIIPSQTQEILKIIASEESKIKPVLYLQNKKIKHIFAPDFSEVFAYVSPLANRKEINNSNIRGWYAFEALMQSNEKCWLLPPYILELNDFLNLLRTWKTEHFREFFRNLDIKDLKSKFKNTEVVEILDDLKRDIEKSALNKYKDFNEVMEIYKKKLGVLYRFIVPKDNFQVLSGYFTDGRIQSSSAFPMLVQIADAILRREPSHWFHKLKKIKPNPESSAPNLRDAAAIAIISEVNKMAVNYPDEYPLVIFVSRSSSMYKVASDDLVFEVPDIGSLHTFWTPETSLAYHLVQQVCHNDLDKMSEVLDYVTSVVSIWPEEM